MEKITKEFYVYDFSELKEDIQEELIMRERDNQRDIYCDSFLQEDVTEKASELLNEYFGITSEHLKVFYDFSYSQGSGAIFEFNINIEDLNNKYKIFSEEEMRFLQDKGVINNIRIRHNSNYYHEYCFKIDSDYYGIDHDYEDINEEYNIDEKDFNELEDKIYDLLDYSNKHYTENMFVQDIIEMNKKLVKCGYDNLEYYWYCDKEEIINYLVDYKYLESGETWYE